MKFHLARFNSIFSLLLALSVCLTGCRTAKDREKEATTLRFFLETNPDPMGRSVPILVGRSAPFELTVEARPFLTEVFIVDASLVQSVGGFVIRIEFNRQGAWLLEQFTTANKGKHIAVHGQFGESRWLAAPLISKGISDGVFVFSPDASTAETERIVRGLKNVAEEVKKKF